MAYANHVQGSSRTVAIVIVALIHATLGYAFVTGLGYQYVKKVAEQLNVGGVVEELLSPEEELPPPLPPVMRLPPVASVQPTIDHFGAAAVHPAACA